MAQNVGRYRELTIETKKLITSSGKQWMNYLETASWNYKYSFAEQVLIFAQRPGATACADFQTWNRQLNRSIRNGAKGIGLLVDVNGQAKIRYVFDISDTRSRYNSQDIKLWEINNSNITQVAKSLESDSYEADLFSRIVSASERMADEYWENYKEDILSSLDNSLMEEYDPFIQKELFCNLVASSVQYATLFRCGLQPQRYFSADDFQVYEWRTDNTVSVLGEVVSLLSNHLLRQIERTIKSYEHSQQMERRQQLMKADHQSKHYQMEDRLHIILPKEEAETNQTIEGLKQDIAARDQSDVFSMRIGKALYTDKKAAGEALLEALKGTYADPKTIGMFGGFTMKSFLSFGSTVMVSLNGKLHYNVEMGVDARGNITRIENALRELDTKLERNQEHLAYLQQEKISLQSELEKPFPKEDELHRKQARLNQLTLETDMKNMQRSQSQKKEDQCL